MSPYRWSVISCLSFLATASVSQAQQNTPRIGYVYPAGGRQGETFQIVVGGQYLDASGRAFFSGDGIRATVTEHVKPLTQKEFNELREQAKQLQEKKAAAAKSAPSDTQKPAEWTAEEERMLAEIRKTLAERAPNRQVNPVISETVTLSITIAPDAAPGRRELRFLTAAGLSGPLVFWVGTLPEFSEKASRAIAEPPNAGGTPYGRPARDRQADAQMHVSLPAVVNGQIMPGDVDRFRFAGKKGQRLVVAAKARELIPYLADAVPGWFQATLTLYDAQGHELAYADDYRFNPDPVLYCEIPQDGEYAIEIKDSIYRGRQDFVYRIAMGELPFVTSIFPLGGPASARTSVELQGWNLPTERVVQESAKGDLRSRIVDLADHTSAVVNPPFFLVDTLPECLEKEANDSPEASQEISFPSIVNGRIDRGDDVDVFRFNGRAGSEIVAEVVARRLGSPLDSVLRLMDATGRKLAINDDCEDKGSGLATHHADSHLSVTLPADGAYFLHLGDAQGKGGREYGYRLRVSPPRPDFELRIVPSSITVRGGATIPLTVYALRKDGFAGDITPILKSPPAGYSLSGWVPAGQDSAQVTLTVPPAPTDEPLSLLLEGRSVVEGREVVRPAVPADDMMQAFFYRHLVPAREFRVAVSGQRMSKGGVQIVSDVPIKIPAGGAARVRVASPGRSITAAMQFEVSDPAEGFVVESVSPVRDGVEIVVRNDAGKVKAGLKDNLIVNALYARPAAAANDKAQAARRRTPAATLPAIPFEIVAP